MLIRSSFLSLCFTGVLLACQNTNEFIPEDPEDNELTCQQSECWDDQFYVCRDSSYIELFTRTFEWTGGDATYSVELPNNKRLWMFGDSFIDQVNDDGSRPSFRLINNSLVVEGENQFDTHYSGSRSNPQSFAKPPEANWWYWPADATLAQDTLYMFMHGFANDTGGAWDFYRTPVDLLVMNPVTLEIYDNRRLFEVPNISWGAAILEDQDYTYVYGVKSEGISKYAYVARTNSALSLPWQYFTGSSWSNDEADAAIIINDVSEQFSVFKVGGVYYLLSQHNIFGFEIYLSSSSDPLNNWGDKKVIYCTPESVGDIFTYNALAHKDVYPDSLLISYNVNSFDYTDLLKDVNNYRPYFVRVGNWQNQ